MNNEVHFSHNTDEWATPHDFFDKTAAEFGGFDLDVCATDDNHKCEQYYTIDNSGLDNPWAAKNWCNPPYSAIKAWVLKARREQLRGNMTAMLIPARTDTVIFHESIYNQSNVEVRFIKGRLKFGEAKNSAPFPSMLVIFKPL
ncbi:MAG TPA: DNA N-6-adenine-methyltransferase [Stellaceae bacterium]|jgi:site-specific DNA-methyltransferase (adenine-specific)|nr:DNA N-6-adenine-methyltransferase [Stellaceae bacterium]